MLPGHSLGDRSDAALRRFAIGCAARAIECAMPQHKTLVRALATARDFLAGKASAGDLAQAHRAAFRVSRPVFASAARRQRLWTAGEAVMWACSNERGPRIAFMAAERAALAATNAISQFGDKPWREVWDQEEALQERMLAFCH